MSKDKDKPQEKAAPAEAAPADADKKSDGPQPRGGVLVAREKMREQKKLMLWKSRVNMIRKARGYMNDKMFSDAAVSYEKYIRVLENVYDCKPGELSPEHFKDSARTQELTVVASVYWDLLRIYDTSAKYGDRQKVAAQKLSEFLKFTPIFPDIMKKAEAYLKQAKNPDIFRQFLKLSTENRGRCFIATSAFESPKAPEVLQLVQFRDQYLFHTRGGPSFIALYMRISPPIARFLDAVPVLKPLVRFSLRKLIRFLVAIQPLDLPNSNDDL